MFRRTLSLFALFALVAIPALAGGPAVVSLVPIKQAIEVGQPATVEFDVSACGRHPMSDLSPALEASSGNRTVRVAATPTKHAGRYRAVLVLPSAGTWTLVARTGYPTDKHAFMLNVKPAGAVARAAR